MPADPKNFSPYPVPRVGVVGPDRVCLGGRVERDGPTWVAVVTFDPKAGPAVKVVYEARAIHDRYDRKAPGPDAAFDKVWRVKANGERAAVADGPPDAQGAHLRWQLVHDGRHNIVLAGFRGKAGADGGVRVQERFDRGPFDPATKALRLLAIDVPHFGQGAHYGLVAICRVPGHSRPARCAIEFAPRKTAADRRLVHRAAGCYVEGHD